MSFDLRIRFNGLCHFVPDGQYGQVHVLLPAVTEGHHHSGGVAGAPVPEHLPRLIFDEAYGAPDAREVVRRLQCHALDSQALTFPELSGIPFDGFLPAEIATLEGVVGALRLPRARVGPMPGPTVGARVTLDAGRVTECLVGAVAQLFNDGLGFRRMTATVEWTIRGIDTRDAEGRPSLGPPILAGLNGAAAAAPPARLYPVADTIVVEVWNVPENDLPGSGLPRTLDGSDHFAAYYDLYDPDGVALPHDQRPIPILQSIQPPLLNPCVMTPGPGGPITPGTQTCMGSQGRLA